MRYLLLISLFLISVFCSSGVHAGDGLRQKILKNQIIKCGYLNYDPMLVRDPNTGEFSGIMYDLTETLGQKLGFKIEWAYESSWGLVGQDLEAGKFDMMCSGGWVNPMQMKSYDYSKPLYFMPVYPVVRSGDNRFNKDISRINSPDVKIISPDGDIPVYIRDEHFPKAQIVTLPNLADYNQLYLDIAGGKADVTFFDADFVGRFIKNNPGKVKIIKTDPPTRLYPTAYVFKHDEYSFAQMINSAVDELVYTGAVDKVLQKHNVDREGYFVFSETYRKLGK